MLLLTLATKQLHIHSVSFLTKVSHPLQKKKKEGKKKGEYTTHARTCKEVTTLYGLSLRTSTKIKNSRERYNQVVKASRSQL